jgi:NADH-quinone oxidoreductase subunit H
MPVICVFFFVSMLAETNRAPFDLPEAEAELVSGYNLEYSSMTFALFFLGEYSNMLLMSALWVSLFFGGWGSPWGSGSDGWGFLPCEAWFGIKVAISAYLFVLTRAILPRARYDMLVKLCWGLLTPLSVSLLLLYLKLYADACGLGYGELPSQSHGHELGRLALFSLYSSVPTSLP